MLDYREEVDGANLYESGMEGVLEQRGEQSSNRRDFRRYEESGICCTMQRADESLKLGGTA